MSNSIVDNIHKLPSSFNDALSLASTNSRFLLVYQNLLRDFNVIPKDISRIGHVVCHCSDGIIPIHTDVQLCLSHSQVFKLRLDLYQSCLHTVNKALIIAFARFHKLKEFGFKDNSAKQPDVADLLQKFERLTYLKIHSPRPTICNILHKFTFLRSLNLHDVDHRHQGLLCEFFASTVCVLNRFFICFEPEEDEDIELENFKDEGVQMYLHDKQTSDENIGCQPLESDIVNRISHQLLLRNDLHLFYFDKQEKKKNDQPLSTIPLPPCGLCPQYPVNFCISDTEKLIDESLAIITGNVVCNSSKVTSLPVLIHEKARFSVSPSVRLIGATSESNIVVEYGNSPEKDEIISVTLEGLLASDWNDIRQRLYPDIVTCKCVKTLNITNLASRSRYLVVDHVVKLSECMSMAREITRLFAQNCSSSLRSIVACGSFDDHYKSIVVSADLRRFNFRMSLQLATDVMVHALKVEVLVLNVEFLTGLYNSGDLLSTFLQNAINLKVLHIHNLVTRDHFRPSNPVNSYSNSSNSKGDKDKDKDGIKDEEFDHAYSLNHKEWSCFKLSWEDFMTVLPVVLQNIRTFCKRTKAITVHDNGKWHSDAVKGRSVQFVKSYVVNIANSWREVLRLKKASPLIDLTTLISHLDEIHESLPNVVNR